MQICIPLVVLTRNEMMELTDGSKLRMARIYRGLTLQQLSSRLGITPNYLSQMETDRRRVTKEVHSELLIEIKTIESVYNHINEAVKHLYPSMCNEIMDILNKVLPLGRGK